MRTKQDYDKKEINVSMKLKFKLLFTFLALLAAGVYYYVTIPAVNIHSGGFWLFIISLVVVLTLLCSARGIRDGLPASDIRPLKIGAVVVVLLFVIYGAGSLLSSPIVNAAKYHQLLAVQEVLSPRILRR